METLQLKLSKTGSEMLRHYKELQSLLESVYDTEVQSSEFLSVDRQNEICDTVYGAFAPAMNYIKARILDDVNNELV